MTDAEYLASARENLEKGDIDNSIIQLKNVLRNNPKNADARLMLGEIYLDMGLPLDSEKELRHAQKQPLLKNDATRLLSKALLNQEKFREVLDLQFSASEVEKTNLSELTAIRGHAHFGLGDVAAAKLAYEEALLLNPADPMANVGMAKLSFAAQDQDATEVWLAKAIEADTNLVEAWSLRGDLASFRGNAEAAEAAYGKAIEIQRWNHSDRFKRAMVRISLDKYDEASEDLSVLKRMFKSHPGASYAEGLILLNEDKYDEAMRAFEASLTANNRYLPALYYSGVTQYFLQNHEQAQYYLERYTSINRSYIPAQQLLAILEIKQGEIASARQRMQPIISSLPDNPVSLRIMSIIALREGNPSEAIEYMQKEASQEPDSANVHARIGMAMILDGDRKLGALKLKKAIELDEDLKLAEFSLVLNMMQQGQLKEAVAAAEEFVAKNPESPMALNLLGLTRLKNEQPDEAKSAFERSLALVPGERGASQNLAMLAIQAGDNERAISLYKGTLEYHPEDLRTRMRLAILYLKLQRDKDAVTLFEETIEQHPEALEPRLFLSRHYLEKKQPEKVILNLQPVADTYSTNPLMLATLGEAQLMLGNAADAVRIYSRLVQIAPRSARFHYYLAMAYYSLGDIDNMDWALGQALKLNPADYRSRLAKVGLLIRKGKPEEAAALLKDLQQTYPEVSGVYLEQAKLAEFQKQPAVAIAAYETAMRLEPKSDTLLRLAVAQWQHGDREATFELLQGWLKEHPSDWLVRYNLASFYHLDGKNEEARRAYSAVVEQRPDHVLALNNLAWLSRHESPEQALEYAERAHQLDSGLPQVKDTLAMLYLDKGETNRALKLLQKAALDAPDNSSIQYHLALALVESGDTSEARKILAALLAEDIPFQEEQAAKKMLREIDQ